MVAPRTKMWASLAGALAVGVASFALLKVWIDGLFDGTSRSVIAPLALVALLAALLSAWITHRGQGRWSAGPLAVAAVWLAWWQVLLWQSLQKHG